MTPTFELLVAALLVAAIAYVFARRRKQRVRIRLVPLPDGDATRYRAMMAEALLVLDRDPQQAAAQARGIVEEAMRRRGFPDRIDARQRVKDLHGVSPKAATAYGAANTHLATGGPDLHDAVRHYRETLDALLD